VKRYKNNTNNSLNEEEKIMELT